MRFGAISYDQFGFHWSFIVSSRYTDGGSVPLIGPDGFRDHEDARHFLLAKMAIAVVMSRRVSPLPWHGVNEEETLHRRSSIEHAGVGEACVSLEFTKEGSWR